jgi:hypothetical protein
VFTLVISLSYYVVSHHFALFLVRLRRGGNSDDESPGAANIRKSLLADVDEVEEKGVGKDVGIVFDGGYIVSNSSDEGSSPCRVAPEEGAGLFILPAVEVEVNGDADTGGSAGATTASFGRVKPTIVSAFLNLLLIFLAMLLVLLGSVGSLVS